MYLLGVASYRFVTFVIVIGEVVVEGGGDMINGTKNQRG